MSVVMQRPSVRELSKKLREAQQALEAGKALFANPAKAVGELMDLSVNDTHELWGLIAGLIEEIDLADYAGTKPPQRSYESTIEGKELFAFSWKSSQLGAKMYLKFALKEETFVYVSLHGSKK